MANSKSSGTGRYYVGHYGIPIFYNGTVHWPIMDPQGNHLVTVLGSEIGVGPEHDAQATASREPADRLVEILNKTLLGA